MTDATAAIPVDDVAEFRRRMPLVRPATPSEVADVIALLAGPDSRFVTGAVIPIDGSLTRQQRPTDTPVNLQRLDASHAGNACRRTPRMKAASNTSPALRRATRRVAWSSSGSCAG